MINERYKTIFGAWLFALAGCDADKSISGVATVQPETTDIVTPSERAAIFAYLNLASVEDDKVINACDEAISPVLHSVELGGEVGNAVLVVLTGGDDTPACYGMTGMEITLLQAGDAGYETLLSAQGQLAVLSTATEGVQDIAIGGPGFEFPVYSWNGRTYERAGTIADTEFPMPVN